MPFRKNSHNFSTGYSDGKSSYASGMSDTGAPHLSGLSSPRRKNIEDVEAVEMSLAILDAGEEVRF